MLPSRSSSHWLRAWRRDDRRGLIGASAAVVVVVALVAALTGEASASAPVAVKPLIVAIGQAYPTHPWAPDPLPSVAAAASAVKRDAALPAAFVPTMAGLALENERISYGIPQGCVPTFGLGTTSTICPLGDASSTRVVAVFGDSHAQMWMPALVAAAAAQGFAVVPVVKPGCLLDHLNKVTPKWPCGTWYQWALQQLQALHPIATIVSFRMENYLLRHTVSTVAEMRQVLMSVPNPVYLAATPDNLPKPAECLTAPGATMRSCSGPEPRAYPAMMQDLAQLARQLHDPALSTVQWFCADMTCPAIVGHIVVMRDGSHLSLEYSAALGPLLGQELQPILDARTGT